MSNDSASVVKFKRAHVTREMVCESAIKSWANDNLDLLTPEELEDYSDIIARDKNVITYLLIPTF